MKLRELIDVLTLIWSKKSSIAIWRIICSGIHKTTLSAFRDRDLMNAAFSLVVALWFRDGTAGQKSLIFNVALLKWCNDHGRDICKSTLDAIRELAYTALKSEIYRIGEKGVLLEYGEDIERAVDIL